MAEAQLFYHSQKDREATFEEQKGSVHCYPVLQIVLPSTCFWPKINVRNSCRPKQAYVLFVQEQNFRFQLDFKTWFKTRPNQMFKKNLFNLCTVLCFTGQYNQSCKNFLKGTHLLNCILMVSHRYHFVEPLRSTVEHSTQISRLFHQV